MQHELGISNYGGGNNPKMRQMMTEENKYKEGLYATDNSGRDPRGNGIYASNNSERDPTGSGSYGKGNTSR